MVCAVGTAEAQQPATAPSTGTADAHRGQTATILSSTPVDGLGEYLIGPDDLLSISVLESADLTREVRVAADGTIGLPMLAEHVHVAGLSLAQA